MKAIRTIFQTPLFRTKKANAAKDVVPLAAPAPTALAEDDRWEQPLEAPQAKLAPSVVLKTPEKIQRTTYLYNQKSFWTQDAEKGPMVAAEKIADALNAPKHHEGDLCFCAGLAQLVGKLEEHSWYKYAIHNETPGGALAVTVEVPREALDSPSTEFERLAGLKPAVPLNAGKNYKFSKLSGAVQFTAQDIKRIDFVVPKEMDGTPYFMPPSVYPVDISSKD